MLRIVAALALCGSLTACGRIRAGEYPPAEMAATQDAWEAHGLPRPSCVDPIELATVGDDELAYFCQKCAPGQCPNGAHAACPNGCTAGCPVFRHGRWVVIQHESAAGEPYPVRHHELNHVLSGCMYGDQDRRHRERPVIWGVIVKELGGT